MKRLWWRTGLPLKHTQPVIRPSIGQLLRQIVVLLAGAALWGGVFLILLGATRSSNVASVAQQNAPGQKPTIAATSTATKSPATSSPATPTPVASTTATGEAHATATATTTAAANTPTPAATIPTLVPTTTLTTSVSFARDVLPIFTQICVKCHGGEKTNKSLVLKSYDDIMQGSENGPVVIPGDPSKSVLVDMIVQGKMPKNGPRLLPKQIQTIIDWINAGAPNN